MPLPASLVALAIVASGCADDPAPDPPPPEARAQQPDEDPADESLRLHVPPRLIHRARREAVGLLRLPDALRAQTLADRRAEQTLDYRTLRAAPDAHEEASVSFEGHVGLVRSAGPRLWILALMTRSDGDRWVDPLYVLSVVPPELPTDGGAVARVDGWVVGERTIGQHTLPLVVAYHVERASAPGGAEDQ